MTSIHTVRALELPLKDDLASEASAEEAVGGDGSRSVPAVAPFTGVTGENFAEYFVVF